MARTPDSDDAALRWDDVDDSSYLTPAGERDEQDLDATSALPSDAAAGGAGDARLASREGDEVVPGSRRAQTASTVVTAAAAVLYAAYTIGWIVAVGRVPLSGPTLALEVAYQFAEFLAIVASGLWFAATVLQTRGRLAQRSGWFALGALVLLPWPFVVGVVA